MKENVVVGLQGTICANEIKHINTVKSHEKKIEFEGKNGLLRSDFECVSYTR